ncbi:hypothetical protein HRR83_007058 [Exophiala dermatitidis]|uniref:Rrn9 domain-containing protein n=1 Tax=Exophiala dermatitidis TaxID=5970 RepID=A0AAN6EQ53_EXODE|nr:hypothetical protein HRR73_006097 [Exophiala dermatitidis]KAJ4512584.1 hypothetical protein HRR74_006282 [Exophiala dermatitidis]KAJ4542379.1 hypothetical protein HRR77_005586 [Exophiala dermatitidis]KAJ4548066.1 hypothetical protein HRR76_000683 [Exophiala dermatitidis]KAJ4568175.1 hypothetical protein HRR82_008078 [Exophiala dermatitidis]
MNSDSSYVEDSDGDLGLDLARTIPPQLAPSSPPRQQRPEHTTTGTIAVLDQSTGGGGDNNDEDATSYFTRPNRYFGPASTWRSWTEQERTVALSLDRVRSQDLSVHLFNAFWLKRKAEAEEVDGTTTRNGKRRELSSKGKERAGSGSVASTIDDNAVVNSGQATQRLTLPKSWTAWPLPPDQVPRDELLPHVDVSGAWRATATVVDMRPSADLEGWLIAIAQKMARERWYAREWQDENQQEVKDVVRRDGDGTSGQQGTDSEVEPASDAEESEEAEPGSDIDDEEQHDPGIPLFSSQAVSPLGSDEDEVEEEAGKDKIRTLDENDDKDHRRPVPLADDEKARQYFLPSARHILSNLDKLLFGLHNARRAYAQKPQGKPRGRRLTSSRSRSRIFQDQPTTTDEEEEEDEDEDEERRGRRSRRSSSASSVVSSTSRSRTRPRTRTDRLNPRDWSDVVGMAALTGWDAGIVERASERCARLFGENMLFRTFHEGGEAKDKSNTSATVNGRHQSQSYFTEFLAMETTSGDSSAEADAGNQVATTSTSVVFRTSGPCDACRLSKSSCQPVHLHLQHGDLQQGPGGESGRLQPCKKCQDSKTDCSGIAVRYEDKRRSRCCPHHSCPRHAVPFRKLYHLQRHLDTVHRYDNSSGTSPATEIQSRSSSRRFGVSASANASVDVSDADMDTDSAAAAVAAAASINLILCPVPDCPRAVKPFSKPRRLYEHVRNMHPEVNVDDVKEWLRRTRGERRGRWTDERRRRGRSSATSRSVSRSTSRPARARRSSVRNTRFQGTFDFGTLPVDQDKDLEVDIEVEESEAKD